MTDGLLMDDDIRKLIAGVVKNYHVATDICCRFMNNEGNFLFESAGCTHDDCFCVKAGIMKNGTSCSNVHLYGKLQAERFGGKYIYFCPAGLTWFISPVSCRDVITGAFLCGPFLMYGRQEFLESEILKKYTLNPEQTEIANRFLFQIPVINPEKVNSLSELLYMASFFSGSYRESICRFGKIGRSMKQQSEISGIIKELKQANKLSAPAYPLDKENELLSAITDGDKPTSSRLLNEILGYIFFSSGGSFEVIRARVLELIVLLSRAALSGGANIENIFGMNYQYISEINKFKNVDELCFWLTEIMNKFINNVFQYNDVKHLDVIYKATDYLRRNFMNKITLDDVASHVYLSPTYFSKIFKDEMKCNFNTYLNRLRIEQSKKLLFQQNVRLADIAGLSGFEDQSYYSKVFKKLTGVTPKKFRENRGNVKAAVFTGETLK